MKVSAIDGRSGFCQEAAAEISVATATFDGGFAIIKAKGTASYFDTLNDSALTGGKALPVGAIVKLPKWEATASCPLKEGDKVLPISLANSCWSTDCPVSYQEGELDQTTQCDRIAGRRVLKGDGIVSESGTINGLFMTDSDTQRQIEGLFRNRIIDKANKITLVPKQSKTFWHFFIYREMTDAADIEITLFRHMRIPQVTEGQAAAGNTPFNFNYTTLESWQYERTIPTPAQG